MSRPVPSKVIGRYITTSRRFLWRAYLCLAGVPLSALGDGLRPTMKGFGSGFLGSEVGKVLMLLFKSSFDMRFPTRWSFALLVLISSSSPKTL